MFTAVNRLRRLAGRFAAERRANVAITFGLALVPILGLTGAAVDFSRANSVKADMQSALDSAALMVSKTAATLNASQVQSAAQDYFTALFTRPEASNIQFTASYANSGGSSVVVSASADMTTDFVGILGYKTITVTSSSTAKWGSTRLRVALVLDNTGSMAQSGKITALKSATNSLLTQLQNAVTTDGDVYVSVVPFVNAINLNPANYNASWIDWTDWNDANGKCSSTKYSTQSACIAANKKWTTANHNTWNGCITDRGLPITTGADTPSAGNYDQNVNGPVAGNNATLYPAFQAPSCPQAAIGLNYNWSSMTSIVNNMQPGGSTDQPIGLVWGWQTLVGGGPFTAPPMDPNYQYKQVIILLSDGLNTQDRWYGDGYTTSTQVDYRMYDANGNGTCANIKAAGITVYTIQVNTDNSPTSTLLQDCASDSTKFFLLTSANQIVTTFNAIGTNLTQLRIAQ
jgi:Flp pilus assembly protein TadG